MKASDKAKRRRWVRLIRYVIVVFWLLQLRAAAQSHDSVAVELYAEGYLLATPGNSDLKNRPPFYCSYTRANRPSINLALARMHYSSNHFRAAFGIMAGDYPQANLAQEQAWARPIYEAYVGYRFTEKEAIWLDAGVFASHIGMETAIGAENRTLTRSIVADNSPYYETGLRLSYRHNAYWFFSMVALNGWQRITAPPDQLGTHWGMQIQYTPRSGVVLNSSSFIGKVLNANGTRYLSRIYSNLWGSWPLAQKLTLAGGWDIGVQETSVATAKTAIWNHVQALLQWRMHPQHWQATLRYEYMFDRDNVTWYALPLRPFRVGGATFSLDYRPVPSVLIRSELQWLHAGSGAVVDSQGNLKEQLVAGIALAWQYRYQNK
jgi:hypothetical protein